MRQRSHEDEGDGRARAVEGLGLLQVMGAEGEEPLPLTVIHLEDA